LNSSKSNEIRRINLINNSKEIYKFSNINNQAIDKPISENVI